MNKPRLCGCKGCRTCLICEKSYNIENKSFNSIKEKKSYIYCPHCNCAWPGWDFKLDHEEHTGSPIDYPGVYVQLDFLSKEEEQFLITNIDRMQWDLSQSGRRKQNYGPKCNFKKRKLQLGSFKGFPKFSEFVQTKFKDVPVLKNFQTVEQCSLEYDQDRGASIDPHIDDCWVWGERIVTVNLLSNSVLTMTVNNKISKYNLDCVETYPSVLNKFGNLNNNGCYILQKPKDQIVVRIPMPRRSLLVMYNSARYDWEHQVLREDIKKRRICLAYREFTPPYLEHGTNTEEGKLVIKAATSFF